VLLAAFGPQHWWPAPPGRETPLAVMVGAVLTQNTNWRNVERAMANLNAAGVLASEILSRLSEEELARLVQPSGFYRVKARRLKALMDWLMATAGGDMVRLRRRPLARLREELLALPGIGPETADCILLYALGKPTFVVDAYTRRALGRHGLIDPGPTRRGAGSARYDEVKALFESSLPPQAPLFNEYHALLVELGKRFCRPRPRCAECPARAVLGEPSL
jgi:endonuclease-3 related protein